MRILKQSMLTAKAKALVSLHSSSLTQITASRLTTLILTQVLKI